MNTQHAILFRSEYDQKLILMWNGGGIFVEWGKDELINLPQLAQFCAAKQDGVTHLWIHPSCRLTYSRGIEDDMRAEDYDCLYTYTPDNILVSLHGYKKFERGRSQRFNIICLDQSSWDWQDLTPSEVMRLVERLELTLGVHVGGSPSGVGMRFLRATTDKHPAWLAKPQTDLTQMPWNDAAKPLIWQRPPTREELNCKYLYAFDKNSAYGRAAYEESFGVGEPVHWMEPEAFFEPHMPGIWRVTVDEYQPNILGELGPSPLWPNSDWLVTPIVRLLKKMEIPFQVHEAWVFPKYAKVYRAWIENLWQWRQDSMGPEKESYKSIINDTLGLTKSSKLGTDTYKYRPDHNAEVVGGARSVMMYNIVKYAQRGLYPIMCQVDAVYYCSNEELPNIAVPGILDHSDSLGGYKLKFKIPMDTTVNVGNSLMTVRALLTMNMPQSKRLRYLNFIGEYLGY